MKNCEKCGSEPQNCRCALIQRTTNRPAFYDDVIATYAGKTILLGLTYEDSEGNLLRRQQFHGIVGSAGPEGVLIRFGGKHEGEYWNMPPHPQAIREAEPGTYTIEETAERVVNPCLIAKWLIVEPKAPSTGGPDTDNTQLS